MKLKTCIAAACVAAAATSFATVPNVTNVKFNQGRTPRVSITYDLDDSAVVTVDVQTNRGDGVWASIGAENLASLSGDLNKVVAAGSRTIDWDAGTDWPKHAFSGNDKIKAVVTAWSTNATPWYMTVSLETANTVRYYASADFVPGGVTNDEYKTTSLLMRRIPAQGKLWRMGISPADGAATNWISGTGRCQPHLVQLSEDYYIGVYPVTQKQFQMMKDVGYKCKYPFVNNSELVVTGDNAGDMKPKPYGDFGWIRGGTWPGSRAVTDHETDIYAFRDFTGIQFDLPTEAQWEFACRAGVDSPVYTGKAWIDENVNEIAFTEQNSDGHLQNVGQKIPNGFGLYDMCGNVWEMCLDWYCDYWHEADGTEHTHAASGAGIVAPCVTVDPAGPGAKWVRNTAESGYVDQNEYRNPRVVKGGAFNASPFVSCVSQSRKELNAKNGYYPVHHGYRLVAPMGGTW